MIIDPPIRGIRAEDFAAEVAWVINRTVEKWGAWNRPGGARQIDISGLLLTSDTSVLLVKMLKYIIKYLINIYQNTRKYMEDLIKYGRISMGPDPRGFP